MGIRGHHWYQAPDLVQITEPCPISQNGAKEEESNAWQRGGHLDPAMPEVHNRTPFQVRGPITSLLCLSPFSLSFSAKEC